MVGWGLSYAHVFEGEQDFCLSGDDNSNEHL